jgi:CBS domain-containing protein
MTCTFRELMIALCLFTVSAVHAQDPKPVVVPPQFATDTKAENVSEVKVFALRNVAAADVQTTLQDIYGNEGGFVVSSQPQTNQLIVVGTPVALNKVEALLAVLDKNSVEPVVQMLSKESRAAISPAIVQTVAEAAQVELSFDAALGLMMVRSESQEKIERFNKVLEGIQAQLREASTLDDREVLIRVSWLSPREGADDIGTVKPDASLKEAIDKLNTLGFSDLTVLGQLMTRCSISSGSGNSTPQFEAEGHTAAGFDLGVRGHFVSRAQQGDNRIDVQMSVNVRQATKAESSNDCLLSVVLKMKEGKPIILGSAPVAGSQSFFVVQFMAAD